MDAFLQLVNAVSGKLPLRADALGHISTDHNNWVVPGHLMAGPFPGLDGVNFPTEEEACRNLRGILQDGISVFVSLVDELPSQDETQPGVLAAPHPYFPQYCHYAYLIRKHGLAPPGVQMLYEELKMVDQQVPSRRALLQLLTRILGHLAAGRRVFIHCAGGHGRTGLVVACVLLCLYGASTHVDDILHLTQFAHDRRRAIDKRCMPGIPPRSPNSAAQLEFVRTFGTFLTFARAAVP